MSRRERRERRGEEKGNGNGTQYMSRKWKLVLLVVILATVWAFLPPLVSAWLLGAEKPLVLLSGTEWVSVITLSVSAYFGANVWAKYVQRRRWANPEDSGVAGSAYGSDYGTVESVDDEDDGKEA
jgi:hypothetical protein